MVADGAYGSELNVAEAAKHGIRLITTNFTGVKPADIFAEFIFSKDGHELLECINHKSPYTFRYDEHNDRCAAIFKKSDCIECPYLAECKPRLRQNSALKELSWKAVNRAKSAAIYENRRIQTTCTFSKWSRSITITTSQKVSCGQNSNTWKKTNSLTFRI